MVNRKRTVIFISVPRLIKGDIALKSLAIIADGSPMHGKPDHVSTIKLRAFIADLQSSVICYWGRDRLFLMYHGRRAYVAHSLYRGCVNFGENGRDVGMPIHMAPRFIIFFNIWPLSPCASKKQATPPNATMISSRALQWRACRVMPYVRPSSAQYRGGKIAHFRLKTCGGDGAEQTAIAPATDY